MKEVKIKLSFCRRHCALDPFPAPGSLRGCGGYGRLTAGGLSWWRQTERGRRLNWKERKVD